MKKILLLLFCLNAIIAPFIVKAQSFIVTSDTVFTVVGSNAQAYDYLVNTSAIDINYTWHVDTSDAPADWLYDSLLSICDNKLCRNNDHDMYLWNDTTHTGATFTSSVVGPSDSGYINFHLNLTHATLGTHYFVVSLNTGSGGSKTMTFVFYKVGDGVPAVNMQLNEAVLYPNPAKNEVNLVYNEASDVKNIAVYNIIGKVMAVYKVGSTSANLDLNNMPPGIYFAKLYSSAGNVVATRKFTKK